VSTKQFLSKVLGEGIHYVGWASPEEFNGYRHKAFTDIDEAIQTARGLAQKYDVFFTPGTFKRAKIRREGRDYAQAYRSQDNVAELKSFFVDVDFKVYASPKQAIESFQAFTKTVDLPKPNLVVSSGNGLHIYWVLDQVIPKEEWDKLAPVLEMYATEHGLEVDPNVTTDSARLLRWPGSFNMKYESKPEVEVSYFGEHDVSFEKFKSVLDAYSEQTTGVNPNVTPQDLQASDNVVHLFQQDNDDLIGDYDAGQKYYMSRVVEFCPTMASILERNGEGDEYALWKNALHLSAYTEDGREFIHSLSNGHKDYDPDEVEQRFSESLKVKNNDARGPTTCELFSKYSDKCLKCKFFGHIKSPIVLGKEEKHKTEDPGITYTMPGRTCMNVEAGEDGEVQRVEIANCEIDYWRLGYDREHGQVMSFKYKVKNKWKQFQFSVTDAADNKKLHSFLLREGVSIQHSQMKLFGRAVVSWMERLQNVQHYEDEAPFGWTEDMEGFAIAGNVYRPSGVREAGYCDPSFTDNYQPAGSFEEWKKAVSLFTQDSREEVHAMMACSFASPLMRFAEVNAFTTVFTSQMSGVGKSTILAAAQSVWAHPVKTMASINDTMLSTSKKMATSSYMPTCYDELRGPGVLEDFTKLIFRAAQGKERQRLNSSAQLRKAEDIHSIIIAASNDSVREAVKESTGDSNAGVLRMFEIKMPQHDGKDQDSRFSAASKKLTRNYGHAGREYMKYVVSNLSKMEQLYKVCLEKINQEVGAKPDERFWTQAGAAFVAGAAAAKAAGICDISANKVHKCVVSMIEDGRSESFEVKEHAQNHVSRVFSVMRSYLLITDEAGTSKNATVASPPPNRVAKMQLVIRSGHLYVPRYTVREYAQLQGLVMGHVEGSLQNMRGVEFTRFALGQGTQDYVNPVTDCYKIDVAAVLGPEMLKRWSGVSN